MRPLSAPELLELWERGRLQPGFEQPLTLLAPACPELSREQLASLPAGKRNRRLLELRASMFGPGIEALAVCPGCGERVELDFSTDDLLPAEIPELSEATMTVEIDEYRVEVRLPDSADLAAAAAEPGIEAASACLRDRCFASGLPAAVEAAVIERMEAADPHGAIQLSVQCPACRNAWEAPFNIAWFLWLEIDAWARRILRDVHTLARAYGWSEGEILALSPLRRQCYLDMVGA